MLDKLSLLIASASLATGRHRHDASAAAIRKAFGKLGVVSVRRAHWRAVRGM
jgi:hypothetical protein